MADDAAPPTVKFCMGCGYSLQGLTPTATADLPPVYRCPECGRAFDPLNIKTFRLHPNGRFMAWLARPVGWPIVFLGLAAAAGILAVSRWNLRTFSPSAVDLVYYLHPSALRHRTSLLTNRDILFTISMLIAIGVCAWWILRTILGFLVRRRVAFHHEEKPTYVGRRHALILIGSLMTAAGAALGWPYRLAQEWIAMRRGITTKPGPFWLPPVTPPTKLSPEQLDATLRAAIIELPQPSQRMGGLQILFEQYPTATLPILKDAVVRESDSEIRALELRLIALHRDSATLPLLQSFLNHSDIATRAAAADAIGILHVPAFTIPLVELPDRWQMDPLSTLGNSPINLEGFIAARRPTPPTNQRNPLPTLPIGPIPLEISVRDMLETMMLSGITPDEREAASRALIAWPPGKFKLRIAEWGVWINEGGKLTLVQSVLDEIPPFVHRTANPVSEFSGRVNQMMFVTKPIIHITVDRPLAIDITAMINLGRPWFAYPRPDDFSVHVDSLQYFNTSTVQPFLLPLDNAAMEKLSDIRQGYPWLKPQHLSSGRPIGGAGSPYNDLTGLGLRWQSIIASPTRLPWMALPEVGSDPRYSWWSRLREVPSSYVSSRDESERFLYYDGPTLAIAPLEAKLVGNEIHWNLQSVTDGEYRFVEAQRALMDLKEDFMRAGLFIRCQGNRLSGQVVPIPIGFDHTPIVIHELAKDNLHDEAVVAALQKMLKTGGLTAAEAEGLIACWRPQFFQTDGTRLLLIMSRAAYDTFCPIQVRPAPTEMARVGIVLTEFS